jgi:hypothetical protein
MMEVEGGLISCSSYRRVVIRGPGVVGEIEKQRFRLSASVAMQYVRQTSMQIYVYSRYIFDKSPNSVAMMRRNSRQYVLSNSGDLINRAICRKRLFLSHNGFVAPNAPLILG